MVVYAKNETMGGQIITVLDRKDWERVKIDETNQHYERVKPSAKLRLGPLMKTHKEAAYVRDAIANKLQMVAERLPQGIVLVLLEGWRSIERQTENWERRWKQLSVAHPDWSSEKLDLETRKLVARPGPLANHHCGGAVDVTLAREVDGEIQYLDMGTPPPTDDQDTAAFRTKIPMLSEEITAEQKANRELLRKAMEYKEFVWYPGEWWHFCWGDRMWAAYTVKQKCYFGPKRPETPA